MKSRPNNIHIFFNSGETTVKMKKREFRYHSSSNSMLQIHSTRVNSVRSSLIIAIQKNLLLSP